ncbi:MAG: CPBP family intramembrane metalloprotease [Candidatus Latescibacteria bacterium]|nr:CPBP family intramembrane metalloprotease [Candidatus Latescibacterota bacterium]
MKLNRLALALLLVFMLGTSNTSAQDDTRIAPFYALVPGGVHFHDGDIGTGLVFSATEVSLLTTGILINHRFDRRELNVPLLLAGQLYAVDKWSSFQKRQLRLQARDPNASSLRVDPTPLPRLLVAPFDPRVVSDPFVLTFAALGFIDGIVAYPRHHRTFSDIATVRAFSRRMSRATGTSYYEGAAGVVSYGAAVSEEMTFRGLLLPLIDHRFGRRTGLVTTSVTFGLAHLFNADIDKPVYFLSQATIAGFVFGYHVQRHDYRLSTVIAAHFWYDVVSATTTWLINPQENPLGVQVGLRF